MTYICPSPVQPPNGPIDDTPYTAPVTVWPPTTGGFPCGPTLTGIEHCEHCGSYHQGRCPRIKAIEYHENGNVKRIEYHEPH